MGRRGRAGDDTTACKRAGTVPLTSADLERLIALRESKHEHVSQSQREEERKIRRDVSRRALRKRESRHNFLRRRLQNFAQESQLTGTARTQSNTFSTRIDPRKYFHEPMKKDWAYYKRTACIWSDYGRMSRNRLSLVFRPLAVKRDREYMERLLGKVEQEDDEARRA